MVHCTWMAKEIAFFGDSAHVPIKWRVSNWRNDRFSLGSWSQLSIDSTPGNREELGKKISDHMILAGEACNEKMPSMVHGAAESGIRAAQVICERTREDVDSVIIVGAGAAGIYAARELKRRDSNRQLSIVLLEARDRVGGRVHSVCLDCAAGNSETCCEDAKIDMGATWLQQYPLNFLAEYATEDLRLDVVPTDFHAALCADSDGHVFPDLHDLVGDISDRVDAIVRGGDSQNDCESGTSADMPLLNALAEALQGLPKEKQRLGELAIAGDINVDMGYDLRRTSSKWALEELGVGNNDHYIKQGYSSILEAAAEGLDIQFNRAVCSIDYSSPEEVRVVTEEGDEFSAQKCICTVPVGVLHSGSIHFNPALPSTHLKALDGIHPALCEKVILQYATRWWPSSRGGLLRWYDTSSNEDIVVDSKDSLNGEYSPLVLNWVEWLDLTDGIGAPVVMGFCTGAESLQRFHNDSDENIALAAASAFEKWAYFTIKHQQNA